MRNTHVVTLLAVAWVSACSATVASSDGGTDAPATDTPATDHPFTDVPSTDQGGDQGGDAALDAVPSESQCPTVEPANVSPCNSAGLLCEYGTDPRRECRDLVSCIVDAWYVQRPVMTGLGARPWCAASPPAATCPATLSAAEGQSCSAAGAVCTYGGAVCECTPCLSFPVGTCDQPLRWQCDAAPAAGCPAAAPRFGEPCATETLDCEYGCNSPDGVEQCTGGVWRRGSFRDCPISTREAKRDIHYLAPAAVDAIARSLQTLRLATYRYNRPELGGRQRLGFILEDQPRSYAADPEHRQVDLYGFAAMLAATVQSQDREIRSLRQRLDALERHAPSRSDLQVRTSLRRSAVPFGISR